MEKLLSTYCVNSAGKYFGILLWSWGLAQHLQRCTKTRRRVFAPGMSDGRSKYSAQGGAVRGVSGGTGTNCEDFVGARPVERELGLENLGVGVCLRAFVDGRSGVAHSHPAANGEFGNRAECIEEG